MSQSHEFGRIHFGKKSTEKLIHKKFFKIILLHIASLQPQISLNFPYIRIAKSNLNRISCMNINFQKLMNAL